MSLWIIIPCKSCHIKTSLRRLSRKLPEFVICFLNGGCIEMDWEVMKISG